MRVSFLKLRKKLNFHYASILLILTVLNLNIPTTKSQNYDIKLVPCGKASPVTNTDCFKYDLNTNSCCFYKYSTKMGCMFLGTRYKGFKEYGALQVECGAGSQLINSKWLLFILILVIIFILN